MIHTVNLKKTSTDAYAEIWQGTYDDVANGVPYHLSVYQRRVLADKTVGNSLGISVSYKEVQLSASGQNTSQLTYVDQSKNIKFGLHCDSSFAPASP